MKFEAAMRELSGLENQMQTQTKFIAMMAEQVDNLTKENKELEKLVISQRRGATGVATTNASSNEIATLKSRYNVLLKESQDANKTILSLTKEISNLKSIIATYSVGVLQEHNYA